jgi:hypothetical protein
MNHPEHASTTLPLSLPAPNYPLVTRMISSPFLKDSKGREEAVTWALSQEHPLVPQVRVERMFLLENLGVEVYSVSLDGKVAMRHFVPMAWIRLVEEVMPLDVFVAELEIAEGARSDDAPEEEAPAAAPSNGAVS